MKATISKRTVREKVEVITEKEVEQITLTLNMREAIFIKCLVGHIGGAGMIRELVDNIYNALNVVCFESTLNFTKNRMSVTDFDESRFEKFDNSPTV